MNYLENVEQLSQDTPIYIYGAGSAGRLLKTVLSNENKEIAGYIDSHKKGCVGSLKIYSPDKFLGLDGAANVIVLIASDSWIEINAFLQKNNIKNVYNAYKYLSEFLLVIPDKSSSQSNELGKFVEHASHQMRRLESVCSAMADKKDCLPTLINETHSQLDLLHIKTKEVDEAYNGLIDLSHRLETRNRLNIKHFEGQLTDQQIELDHLRFDIAYLKKSQHYDITEEEYSFIDEVRGIAATSIESLVTTSRAVRYIIENDIPGSFIECGIFHGAQIIIMLRTLISMGITDRDVYCYDTFKGMPKPEEVDGFISTQTRGSRKWISALDEWKKMGKDGDPSGSDWVCSPLVDTRKNILKTGYREDKIHFIVGLVEETIPEQAPDRIALLRLDTDFYRSTKHEMIHLFPILENSGILIVDDYGAFTGAKKAVDEYFTEKNIRFYLARVDGSVRIGVKIPG